MAIKALPITQKAAYASIPGLKPAAAPKPAAVKNPYTISKVGYTGSGWNYPSTPAYMLPHVTVPTQTTPTSTGTATGLNPTTAVPRSTVPGNYTAGLDEILGNPLSQSALGQYNTNMQTLMNALRGNIGQSVIKSGYDPTAAFQSLLASRPDLGDFSNLIDPAAIATANQNPLSEKALADQAYSKGMSDLDYSLAARGLGGSGAQVTGGNQILQNKQLAENQSRQGLLDAINSGIGGYLTQKTSGFNSLQDTYAQVAQLLAQQQGAVPDVGSADLTDQENAGVVPEPGTNVPSAATHPTNYVVWGGQQMHNATQMKSWLAQHGQNWNAWAARYPAAARQLMGLS